MQAPVNAAVADLPDFSVELDSPQPDGADYTDVADFDLSGLGDFEVDVATPAAPMPELVQPDVQAEPEPAMDFTDTSSDDQIKVIGPLRIGIPLYNVYLNEADEWSRRLVTEVTEWALELNTPVADSTVGLAHALAGSSATVGFAALSEMARALEHALLHAQLQSRGTAAQAKAFTGAAEDIRRLLHQFAAGFLKEPDAQILQSLRQLETPESLQEPSEVGAHGAEVQLAQEDDADLHTPQSLTTASGFGDLDFSTPASVTILHAPQPAVPEPEFDQPLASPAAPPAYTPAPVVQAPAPVAQTVIAPAAVRRNR